MKNLLFVIFSLFILCSLNAQNNFTVEWEGPADRDFIRIAKWEKNNNIPELVFRSPNKQTIYVYDGATKQLKYTYSDPDTSLLDYTGAYPTYNPIDVNNDNIFELLSNKRITIKVINGANGQPLYQNTYTGYVAAALAGMYDVDGDGYTELLITLYNSAYRVKLIILSTTSTYVGIKEENTLPTDYKLEQNYPNPFNPTTKIDFYIAKNGYVKLVIYDISGREIETLVNEYRNAGSYSETFSSDKLSSGTYFYQLIIDGIAETKKMMTVK